MTRWTGGSAFSIFLLGVAAFFLIQSLSLNPIPRLVPLFIAVPTLALIAVQVSLDLRGNERPGTRVETTVFSASDVYREKALSRIDTLRQTGRKHIGLMWLAIMFGLIYLLGLLPSAPVYSFLYLKVRGRTNWSLSAGIAAGIWLLSYVLLVLLSNSAPYRGKIWIWQQ